MKKAILVILGIIFMFAVALGLWFGIKEVAHCLKSTDSKLTASLITASATLLVGIGAVLISQNRIKKREIEEAHRESKIKLYNRFNDFLFKLLSGENKKTSGKKLSEQEIIDFMVDFKRDMMFRASPVVIKAMLDYEKSAEEGGNQVLAYMNELLLCMRKDIGLGNRSLNNFELIQIFLKDKSEVDKIR